RNETAGVSEKAGVVDRGQAMLGCQGGDQAAMDSSRRAADHNHTVVGTLCERREGALDLAGISHVGGSQLHAPSRRKRLDRAELSETHSDAGVTKDRSPRHSRSDLLEQLQPFPAD